MRLDSKEIEAVRTMVETIVGKGSKVRVFGSRLNDSKRGGDLDLLVESDAPVDALRRADLKLDLEEKLALPVDIIFLEKGKKRSAFQELAYSRSGLL
ncbi:MAG: nucleotidyltransferase domain-containing protein [Spartobacteria bacterium]|jgi:predicted nucleotidyltransferase|nr:nucleotidyltransferase domain-containing protein [Spartobacteria bacterium]